MIIRKQLSKLNQNQIKKYISNKKFISNIRKPSHRKGKNLQKKAEDEEAFKLKKVLSNQNIPIQITEKEIYSKLKKENQLPEIRLKELIDKSIEYFEVEFKNQVMNLLQEKKNFLNKSIIEICRITYKNPYFKEKFPEFWELICDEIDLRIESNFTNQQIVDITNYISKVDFDSKNDFFLLMEDTILDSPLPFSPQDSYSLLNSYLKSGLGTAPFFNLLTKRVLKHKDLFTLTDIVRLTSLLNTHRYTIDNNFKLNVYLDETLHSDEMKNISTNEIFDISSIIYKNNLLENRAKHRLENILYERISDRKRLIEPKRLINLMENIYNYEYFKGKELFEAILNRVFDFVLVSSDIQKIYYDLTNNDKQINDYIHIEKFLYEEYSTSSNNNNKLVNYNENSNNMMLLYKNNSLLLKDNLVKVINLNYIIDNLPHFLSLFLKNRNGIDSFLKFSNEKGMKNIFQLIINNMNRYTSREKVFLMNRINKLLIGNEIYEEDRGFYKEFISKIVNMIDVKKLTPHENRLLELVVVDGSDVKILDESRI